MNVFKYEVMYMLVQPKHIIIMIYFSISGHSGKHKDAGFEGMKYLLKTGTWFSAEMKPNYGSNWKITRYKQLNLFNM